MSFNYIGTFMFKYFILLFVFLNSITFAIAEEIGNDKVSTPVKEDMGVFKSTQEVVSWSQFSFENDAISIFNKSDDGYSNGLLFAWGETNYNDFESLKLPDWIRYISDWTYINQGATKQYAITYGVSQLMYTPDELEASEIVKEDRPYAGSLLWSSKIHSYGNDRSNSLGLTLGIVGPASLAELSQTVIHKIIGATTPEGWDHQIDNELVFRVEGEHVERFYTHDFSGGLSFDTSSYSKAGVGNLYSDIGTGLTVRLGNMLDNTYSTINNTTSGSMSGIAVRSNEQINWQVFSTVYASYLFNDITFDGNTFWDSAHTVDLIHEQIMISAGVALVYNNWGMVFSVHRGSDQFEGQQTLSKYGSIALSYRY